ncbi:MAG: serine/threonine-protein phosphatase [Spirochaetales bacterium]|nr:serine/threonine-protein phosphatase [Spirochaetales bacterium]
MALFYIFSFMAIGLFSLALWGGIAKNKQFGNRPLYLLLSILLFFLTGGMAYANLYIFSDPLFVFAGYSVVSLLYLLSFFLLEYSVHCQRILKSFLMDDFKIKMKSFYGLLSVILVLIGINLMIYINRSVFLVPIENGVLNNRIPFFTINFILCVVFGIFYLLINIIINKNIFELQKGVIRKQGILFSSSIFVLAVSVILFVFLNGFGEASDFVIFKSLHIKRFPLEIMGVLNIVYAIRLFSEYYFQRILNEEKTIDKLAKSVELKNDLINLVLNSPESEDINIIRSSLRDCLDRSTRNLVVDEYGITGLYILRCSENMLKLESEDLIMGYCTPLVQLPNINLKKKTNEQLTDIILKTSFDIKKLSETAAETITGWGNILIKSVLDSKKPVIVDPIPKEFAGLQRLIALFPIINLDKFYGIVVIFKDSFEFLFPEEKSALNESIDDLKIIFSIIEGKRIQKEKNRLDDEVATARRIQVSILPRKIEMDGYDASAYMETATEVGGDAYDVFNSRFGNYLGIGDVSGHGLPAGITALIQQAAFQSSVFTSEMLEKPIKPSNIYNIVNKVLCRLNSERIGSDKFMTQNYIREKDGLIEHAGAHEIALLYKNSEEKVVKLPNFARRTAFMGLSSAIDATNSEGRFKMDNGDVLVLYTDGIIEAMDHYYHQFGIAKLEQLLEKYASLSSSDLIKVIVEKVKEHATSGDIKKHNGKLADDITMLVIKKM